MMVFKVYIVGITIILYFSYRLEKYNSTVGETKTKDVIIGSLAALLFSVYNNSKVKISNLL
jgi:TRAP-type uncharacterized transport system fused permease subunit